MSRIQSPDRFLAWVSSQYWAIYPPKAAEIVAFFELRREGHALSEAELAAITSRQRGEQFTTGEGVAVIPLMGVIAQRASSLDESSGVASLERFREHFDAAVANEEIGTIVLHIDSPGGSVDGVQEMADRIYAARSSKRIIAVADPLCASAAYHQAAAASEIVITPSGMAGSIGCIAVHTEWSKWAEAMGFTSTVFTSGRGKGEGNPHEPLSEDAAAHIQQTIADYDDQFVAAVSQYRGISEEDLRAAMTGRVYTSKRAVAMGLADRVATLDEVLASLGVKRRQPTARAQEHDVRIAAAMPGVDLRVIRGRVEALSNPRGSGSVTVGQSPARNAAEVAGAAAATLIPAPDNEGPQAQEAPMAESATKPQAEAGAPKQPTHDEIRASERERQRRIREICALHPNLVTAEQLDQYLESGTSAEQVMDAITQRARTAASPAVTPAQPDEERKATGQSRVIRHRGSARLDEPGFRFGMSALALAASCYARAKQNKHLDPADFLKEGGFPEIAAAMRSDRFDQGGAWVPENYLAGEFIELLRPMSAVRALNPRFVELVGGQASLPGLQGGATSYYKAESSAGTKSEATSRRVNLVSRELMTFVPITYQLLRRATPDAGAMVRDDAVAASAQRSDLAFIRGDGTENSPKGLRHQAASANVIPANNTVNLANVTTDLGKLRLALLNANVKMQRPGWIMAPRTEHYLMTVRDGNGNYAFRAEMLAGSLWGYPYQVTTQIPINLGGGTESEVYFADFADVVIGEEEGMQIDVFDQVTYWDGSAWQSAAQNNEIVLRIVEHHDIAVRYQQSAAILTGVTWGA